MTIRRMELGDLRAIREITVASPEAAAWARSAYEALLENSAKGEVWVGEDDGAVVGFACFRLIGKEAELLNLAVDPGWRRKGIGLRLVEHTLSNLTKRGVERIFLEVRASNETAQRLYQRVGFTFVGRRPGYYPNLTGSAAPGDALVLARDLTSTVPNGL